MVHPTGTVGPEEEGGMFWNPDIWKETGLSIETEYLGPTKNHHGGEVDIGEKVWNSWERVIEKTI